MERTRNEARERGYVETVFGRRLYLEYIRKGTQGQRAGAERAAINAPMQGTAADIIKRAMVAVDAWLAPHAERAKMILQVHDELVFEDDEDFVDTLLAQAPRLMSSAAELRVPLVVDSAVGKDWDEAHCGLAGTRTRRFLTGVNGGYIQPKIHHRVYELSTFRGGKKQP